MPISTDKDRVRLLISDVGGTDSESFLFTDDEIETFLEMRGGVDLAAALALRTIAGNEVQVSKRIRFLELTTDGPSVAKELRAAAAELEERADTEEGWGVEVADMAFTDASARELRGVEL